MELLLLFFDIYGVDGFVFGGIFGNNDGNEFRVIYFWVNCLFAFALGDDKKFCGDDEGVLD